MSRKDSLIIAYPPHLMAYTVAHEKFDPRVIPESYVRIVWEMMPLDRPSDILRRDPRITGCSYLFSLFQDKRITE